MTAREMAKGTENTLGTIIAMGFASTKKSSPGEKILNAISINETINRDKMKEDIFTRKPFNLYDEKYIML